MSDVAGLYVHIPFCSAICPYCDFAVLVGRKEKRRAYVETLCLEIDRAAEFPYPFDTIYFGGGTPSLLDGRDLERLLRRIEETFDFVGEPRLFLEANPEDVDEASLALWRSLGVRTLSLGVQSFEAAELAFLGRQHDPETSRSSVELALTAGFDTVSVDLIYALPEQEAETWRRTLELAAELGPHHLSCYELEVHERTTFGKKAARGELSELSEDRQADLFYETHRFLNGASYSGYEVSSFARAPRHQSRHNRKYWHHTPYLGLGASAHSFDGERRFWNERSTVRYEAKIRAGQPARAGEERLTRRQRALEEVMLGLRTYAGVDLARFHRAYGVDLTESNGALIERWRQRGQLEVGETTLKPTLRGLAVADALAASLDLSPIPDSAPPT